LPQAQSIMDIVRLAQVKYLNIHALYDATFNHIHRFFTQLIMRLTLLSTFTLWFSAIVAQSSIVDTYIASESPIAKAGLLANIGPNGSKCAGAEVLSRHLISADLSLIGLYLCT
jgi:hypothetical protein